MARTWKLYSVPLTRLPTTTLVVALLVKSVQLPHVRGEPDPRRY